MLTKTTVNNLKKHSNSRKKNKCIMVLLNFFILFIYIKYTYRIKKIKKKQLFILIYKYVNGFVNMYDEI